MSDNKCSARTVRGEPCKLGIVYRFENLCTRHHNYNYAHDPAYKARYDAHQAERNRLWAEEPIPVLVPPANAMVVVDTERIRAEAAEVERQRVLRVRAEKQAKNERTIQELNNPNLYKLLSYATKLMALWKRERIESMDCPKAYVVLKYTTITNADIIPRMIQLVKAVATVYLLSAGHHPVFADYANVPVEQKTAALEALRAALVPFGEIQVMRMLPVADSYYPDIHARQREEDEVRRRAEAEAAERERAEARRRQLAIDLRERPVVFARDNADGTVNLRAFGTDHQNVHRSSVQSTTQKSVGTLMTRPVPEGQETLPEIVVELENPKKVKITAPGMRERIIAEVTHDYFETEAFSTMYGAVLDRVWAYIRGHKDRFDLSIRLAQEIAEGLGQCSNGKMARLINVLQGYDDTLMMDHGKEVFQNKIAMLRHAPREDREAAARALFAEHHIPEEEHATWLEPLLEV